jgi:hypothetical protein
LTSPVEKAKNQAVIRLGIYLRAASRRCAVHRRWTLPIASLSIASAMACGRAQGVSDQDLGGLVVDTKVPDKPIDLDTAAKDPAELGRALVRPYAATVAAIGPHVYVITTKTQIEEGGKVIDELSEQSSISLGEGGAFKGEYTNSADYGREVTFTGGKLYLRPRYQRWHGRAPETADEPTSLRDSFVAQIGATWDLLAPAAELTDLGATKVGTRAARKIAIKLSPTPAKNPAETVAQKKWREGRAIEELAGEVALDAEKGVPLTVQLQGAVGFTRDGRRFRMKVQLTGTISAIGSATAITAPPESDVVATPERLREVDDRDTLLQGIAPPIRNSANAGSGGGK